MSFSLVYLIQRFFYRIIQFLRHWHIGGFLAITHWTLNILERLDRVLALRITLRFLFKPLYQDYTILGYLLGFIFRSSRILIAAFVYTLVIAVSVVIYLAWAAIPIYLVYKMLY